MLAAHDRDQGVGSGCDQESSAPGRPKPHASAAAIRSCPRELAWRRSTLHSRGSDPTECFATSTRIAPLDADARRSASFNAATRLENRRVIGMTSERSGRVNPMTVAPFAMSARCMCSASRPTASASNRRDVTSFTPVKSVTRSGRSASAGWSCSLRMWRVVRPRIARFA